MHRALIGRRAPRPTYFFAAAAAVTGWTKLGGAELAGRYVRGLGAETLSNQSLGHLGELGRQLYARVNLPLYQAIRKDELPGWLRGLSGRGQDQAIIQREQTYVETWLAALPLSARQALVADADQTLTRSRCPAVRKALQRIGGPFSFADQRHREAIGLALADRARAADWR